MISRAIRRFIKKCYDWFNGIWVDGKVHATSVIDNCTLGEYTKIGKHSYVYNTSLGSYSYLAGFNIVGNVEIGKFCSIGSFVSIGPGNHPSTQFVSTHPVFFSLHKQCGTTFSDKFYFNETDPVAIGNDVWIGNNAIILNGVTIGDGAIIAAGTVVNKDVPPYSIVGGVPGKVIKQRFTEEEIAVLVKSKWWDKDVSWLKSNAHVMRDINKFMELEQ